MDTKLLRNVVAACGGALSTQTPTPRVLASDPERRHVVAAPADRAVWRPLVAAGFKVYNQEVVLTSALKQEVEWDDEAYVFVESA